MEACKFLHTPSAKNMSSLEAKVFRQVIQPRIDISLIKAWFQGDKNYLTYENWLNQIPTPTQRLEVLKITLADMLNNWHDWIGYFSPGD